MASIGLSQQGDLLHSKTGHYFGFDEKGLRKSGY